MKIHHWGFILLALFTALAFGQDYIVWSGGVSEQEREDAPTGTTKLVFFKESGPYLASVDVEVRSESGNELVSTTTRGPWLVLDLPDGQYTVEARRENGDTESASFQVDGGENKEVALAFPDEELPEGALQNTGPN